MNCSIYGRNEDGRRICLDGAQVSKPAGLLSADPNAVAARDAKIGNAISTGQVRPPSQVQPQVASAAPVSPDGLPPTANMCGDGAWSDMCKDFYKGLYGGL